MGPTFNLEEEIEKLRMDLNLIGQACGLLSEFTLKKSRELDDLINEYIKNN